MNTAFSGSPGETANAVLLTRTKITPTSTAFSDRKKCVLFPLPGGDKTVAGVHESQVWFANKNSTEVHGTHYCSSHSVLQEEHKDLTGDLTSPFLSSAEGELGLQKTPLCVSISLQK